MKNQKITLCIVFLALALAGSVMLFLCGCGTRIACAFGKHVIDDGTVTQEGIKVYHCSVCNTELEDQREVTPKLPHTYVVAENYRQLSGYRASDETHAAMIPCSCGKCLQNFVVEYDQTTFSEAAAKVSIDDKYSTTTPIIFDTENKFLVINLVSGDTALQQLKSEGLYDYSTKVLTLPLKYMAVTLTKIKVVGFKTPAENFAISTQIGNSINVILQNLSYSAPNNTDGLNLYNVNIVNMEISGVVDITAAAGKAGISAKNLNVTGEGGAGISGNISAGEDFIVKYNGNKGAVNYNLNQC